MSPGEITRSLLPLGVAAIVLIYATWLVTGSTWVLVGPEQFSGYYDSQARGLLDGRWNVDCESIGYEAFLVDGRCYGYYGPTPAILRIPLVLLFPQQEGNWGRLSLLAATLVSFWLVYRSVLLLLSRFFQAREGRNPMRETAWATGFAAISIVCSTQVFLASTPFIYHEAIVWAAAFSYGSIYLLACYLTGGSIRCLYAAWLFAFMAVQSRVVVGLGALAPVLAVSGLLCVRQVAFLRLWTEPLASACGLGTLKSSTGRHYVGVFALTLLALASPFLVSLAKWGSVELLPFSIYVAVKWDPITTARIGGTFFHPSNFLFNLKHYFTLFSMQSLDVFPYFRPGPWDWGVEPGKDYLLQGDPFLSLPITMPVFLLLSGVGVFAAVRRRELACLRLLLLGTFLSGVSMLLIAVITMRYTHDFWGFLVFAGAIGWVVVFNARAPRRYALLTAALLLSVYGAYVNFGSTMGHVFITRDWANWTVRTRDALDGKPAETSAVPTSDYEFLFPSDNLWRTGVLNATPFDMVILPWNRGLHPGARLVFAGSGERTILQANLETLNQRPVLRLQVSGPLDPARDGAPNPVRYRAWPNAPPRAYYPVNFQ
jgi:hypothetical protein